MPPCPPVPAPCACAFGRWHILRISIHCWLTRQNGQKIQKRKKARSARLWPLENTYQVRTYTHYIHTYVLRTCCYDTKTISYYHTRYGVLYTNVLVNRDFCWAGSVGTSLASHKFPPETPPPSITCWTFFQQFFFLLSTLFFVLSFFWIFFVFFSLILWCSVLV